MNESVCNANLSFSFSSREQCSKFIKLFLKNFGYADNINYETINNFDECGYPHERHCITIKDIHWAENLIAIAKLIKKCDYKDEA